MMNDSIGIDISKDRLDAFRLSDKTHRAFANTDRVDARMLAQMGEAFDLQPDQPVDETTHELKELQIERSVLVKDRTRLLNRIKSHSKARIAQIERQLAAIQAEIETRLREDDGKAGKLDLLTSIPGIGPVTAAAIMIECPEIGTLGRKQIASLAGVAPMTRQSGQWRGKAFIQGGRKLLRDALYMPALVAMRLNTQMKANTRRCKAPENPEKSP